MIPTAEQLMQANNGDDYTHWEEIHDLMIKFARMHVKEALRQASERVEVDFPFIDKESVLKVYPPENIK